jgi:hypothetical protein
MPLLQYSDNEKHAIFAMAANRPMTDTSNRLPHDWRMMMSEMERKRIMAQQAMAVDIEIAIAAIGPEITEAQGQRAMNAAWNYVDEAVKAERTCKRTFTQADVEAAVLGAYYAWSHTAFNQHMADTFSVKVGDFITLEQIEASGANNNEIRKLVHAALSALGEVENA